jgi:hypothetical protein
MAIDIRRLTRLTIGINTESGVEEYRCDMLPWLEEHPGLHTFQLNVTPPGGMPYMAETYMEGDVLVWPITASDTALPGDDGWYEIEAFGDDGLHKLSPKRSLAVIERMVGDLSDAPQTIQNWVEEANEALEDNRAATLAAEESAAAAEKAAEEAEKAIDATEKATEKAEAATAAAEAVCRGAVVRNLLDNSDFTQLIAQAGFMGNHGTTTYLADRWYHATPNLQKPTYDTTSRIITFPSENAANVITQKVASDIYGKVVTLAIKASNVSGSVHLSEANTLVGHRDAQIVDGITSYSFTAGNDARVAIWSHSGGSLKIDWIALYEGSYTAETLPAYQPKGYAAELAECQRYYLPLMNEPLGFGYINGAGNTAYITIPIPQQMRVTPTPPPGKNLYVRDGNAKEAVSTTYNVDMMTANAVRMLITVNDVTARAACSAFGYDMYLCADL